VKNSKATNKIEKLIYNIIRQNNKFIMLTIVKKIPRLTILVLHALIREPPQINLKTKHNSINKDGKRCIYIYIYIYIYILGIEILLLVEVQYAAAIFGLKRHSYI
jgi:hypothetical protein